MIGFLLRNSYLYQLILGIFLGVMLYGCSFNPLKSKPDSCEKSSCCLERPATNTPHELAANTSEIIEICACRPWNNTGIKVEKNQMYTFQIEQILESWVDGETESDPSNGWDSGIKNDIAGFLGGLLGLKRSNNANWYTLTGTIDKNDDNSFTPLKYTSNPLTIANSGEFYFYANDKDGRYFNNRGILRLKVTHIKPDSCKDKKSNCTKN